MTSLRNASLRHAKCFAAILLNADELYQQGGDRVEGSLQLFDANWQNIEKGQQWAANNADVDEDAAILALEFPERGANCLYLRQKPSDRILWLQKALQIAHVRGLGYVEASLMGKLGLAFQEMGQHPQAIEYYAARLELAQRLNDEEGWAETACNLGILYDDLNILETAREWFQAALQIAEKISNDRIKERAFGNVGLVYLKLEKFSEALTSFESHLQLARAHGDLWSEGNALTNMGIACLKLQQHDWAESCFQQSLAINQKLVDLEGEAKNWSYIGLLHNQLGDLDGAAQAYRTRIDLAKKMNDARGEALCGWNLGDVLIKQNQREQGVELLYKYVDYEKSVGDPAWEQDWETARRMEERCRSQEP
jgi:tetratricopeptide (TPR) repeat protein